jgi:hypothetical protein
MAFGAKSAFFVPLFTAAHSKSHGASVWIVRIRLNFESELPAHCQHRGVFAQHLSLDGLEPFRTGVFDDQLHEQVT